MFCEMISKECTAGPLKNEVFNLNGKVTKKTFYCSYDPSKKCIRYIDVIQKCSDEF